MKNKAAAFHPFAYLAAFGISGAMGGMLMCVNTLLMLDRGLSLAQVALGLSLFSITQVLLEVPSGMLGDLYGRKRIWMAAMLVRLCYLPLFLFASGPILLAGYVGNGAANALNSGTLDAMYLENWLHARGKKTLARGTALQQAVQYGSQAAGALLGGGLSTLKFFRPYSVNILACTALCVTGLLVAVFAIPADGAARRGTFSPRGIAAGFCAQAGQTVRLAKASPLVLLCLLSVLPYGFAGIGIEAYWQPRLLELLNGAQPGILLGVFSCTAMGGVTASGFLAGKLVRRANTTRRRVALFLAIRAALTALLAALAIVLVALIHFPLVPAAPFLEYDPADIPIFIGTFLFGPAAGLALTAVVCVIQGVTVSAASGPIGIIMHFLATGTFVLLAGNLYRAHRTRKAALLGLAAGTLAMTAVMCVCNLVFTPLFMGSPVGEVVKLLLPAIIPFNLAKAAINSVITYLVYKPISRLVFGEKEPAAS